jgi:hypothetical protein
MDTIMERTAVDLIPNLVRSHRRNGRTAYDREAKRELVRRVLQPGVSLAGTALAHGVNADLLRRWVVLETGKASRAARQEASCITAEFAPGSPSGCGEERWRASPATPVA